MSVSAEQVRQFVLATIEEPLRRSGWEPEGLGDDFDLLESGVIDSLGVLELIEEVNERFGLDVDFEELDPEGLTVIGSFSRYVAASSSQENTRGD